MNKQKQAGQPLVNVQGLERYKLAGWTWTLVFRDRNGKRQVRICRTNGLGEGLWFWDNSENTGGGWVQGKNREKFSLSYEIEEAYQEIKGWAAWAYLGRGA